MKADRNVLIEHLYQTYYMDVYSYVMSIMKNPQTAEEITQDTFYRAMRSDFKGHSNERTWLCAIAKNICMDVFRKRKKEKPLEEVEDERQPAQDFLSRTETIEIHKALHMLEEPYKEVFTLRVFGELSFREVGEVFGKTENWARVTYHRGKLKLKERIDGEEWKG